MVPHMHTIAAPWLAGTYDSDRSAAKAAQDALKQTFNTPDKLANLSRVFQKDILTYCKDVIQNETVQTISDERSVSKDDAEATYARVIATCLAVISNLVQELPLEEQDKQHEIYAELLGDDQLWAFTSHDDVSVRRAALRLLRNGLDKKRDLVQDNLKVIGTALIAKALPSDQTGSATELVHTTADLTTAFPTMWTSEYSSKKSPLSRLRQCVKRGSQNSPPDYWSSLWRLLSNVAIEVLPKDSNEVKDLLKALHEGATNRDERFNASSAWETYFKIVDLISRQLPENEQDEIIMSFVLPVIEQYLNPTEAQSQWSLSGARPAWNVSKAAHCSKLANVLVTKWPQCTAQLIESIKTSQPEQSKEFEKSQKAVAAAGERWALLQVEFLKGDYQISDALRQAFQSAVDEVVRESLDLLRSRNGKPLGAAAVIDGLLTNCPQLMATSQDSIVAFLKKDASNFVLSPSQPQLFSLLYHLHESPQFDTIWTAIAHALSSTEESPEKISAFRSFLASPRVKPAAKLALESTDVQKFLQSECESLLLDDHDWTFISSVLKHSADIMSAETRDHIMSTMLSSLSVSDQAKPALQGLDNISKNNKSIMDEFMAKSQGSELLPKLLLLEESPDEEVAQKANDLSKQLFKGSGTGKVPSASIDVVQKSLNSVSTSSLPIHTTIDMAGRLIDQSGTEPVPSIMPDITAWRTSLDLILAEPSPPSLSIMSPIGGSVFLTEPDAKTGSPRVAQDSDGYSLPLRCALYIVRLFSREGLFDTLPGDTQTNILFLLDITTVLAGDNISVRNSNAMWAARSADQEANVIEYISQAYDFVKNNLKGEGNGPKTYTQLAEGHLHEAKGLRPYAFHHARVYATMRAQALEIHGCSRLDAKNYLDMIKAHRKTPDNFQLPALLAAFKQPLWTNGELNRYTNELVADITGADIEKEAKQTFERLVYLNIIISDQEIADGTIAKQRLIFYVKHVIPWLEQSEVPAPLKAEVFKSLAVLMPCMSDMYGEHWSQLLNATVSTWTLLASEDQDVELRTVLLNASLRLFGSLRSLKTGDEPNDDLVDAWKEKEPEMAKALIDLLAQNQDVSDDEHQPLKITNDLIAREISKLSKIELDDAGRLYSLLYAPSHSVQQTSFNLLHRQIPASQEQISFDAALENKSAHLPDELLSLILETPTLESLADASFERSMPLDLKGYLYSWMLIFDHFTNSSYKVKTDYIENLKEGDYLAPLLNFTFDFLGHSVGRPFDASKVDVTKYIPDTEESPEKDTQWLLTHLYYLALTHVASLTKAHFLSLTSRQTSLAVSSWTSKHISPRIISESLASVSEWSNTAGSDPEYSDFTVKVSSRSKEVNVSYLVDEQTMAIVVRLPDEYPLQGAKVDGISRVAVDEKRWQSWLRNCQGVITFSNGNLIDGLSSWRKNVTGALKGQTECAICYSIISSDKQLPSKRCGTCKNLFHSSCLFKWFKSSNASSCPLCRNAFNYG